MTNIKNKNALVIDVEDLETAEEYELKNLGKNDTSLFYDLLNNKESIDED